MTRAEALRAVADAHQRWSARYGDTVPYQPTDAGSIITDLPLWQATVSAPARAQDELWTEVDAILTAWRAS